MQVRFLPGLPQATSIRWVLFLLSPGPTATYIGRMGVNGLMRSSLAEAHKNWFKRRGHYFLCSCGVILRIGIVMFSLINDLHLTSCLGTLLAFGLRLRIRRRLYLPRDWLDRADSYRVFLPQLKRFLRPFRAAMAPLSTWGSVEDVKNSQLARN